MSNPHQISLTARALKMLFLLALTSMSSWTLAATSITLSESDRWGVDNILAAENFAIIVNGKANIIDTPEITKIESLYKRFFENEIAVLKKHLNKPQLISLNVGRVAAENSGPVVYGAWSSPKIRYEFNEGSAAALAKLGRGATFPATCTLKSISRNELVFTNCEEGETLIKAHVSVRKREILEYLQGGPARSPQTSRQAVTLLSLIRSKPSYSPCVQPPPPELTCFSELENNGKYLVKLEVKQSVILELKQNGFDL